MGAASPESISGDGPEFSGYAGIRPALDGIPLGLTAVDNWVLFKETPKPAGGMNKIPYQPTGRPASSTDPATWADFGTLWSAYEEAPGEYGGSGSSSPPRTTSLAATWTTAATRRQAS